MIREKTIRKGWSEKRIIADHKFTKEKERYR